MKFARRNFNLAKKGRDWCVGKSSNPQGQTLLELIVVLGIFIMMVSGISSVFISIINAERRALAIQEVLNNTRYTIEIMARAIRQADPDSLNTTGGLEFIHPMKQKMKYQLTGSNIEEVNNVCLDDQTKWCAVNSDCAVTCYAQDAIAITPSNVRVERLSFQILGQDTNDQTQPRVVISLRLGAQPNANPAMDIQTTVSLRTMQE